MNKFHTGNSRQRATDGSHENGSCPWTDDQTWRQLVEQLPVPVYACDADGRLSFFNAATTELWGREPEIGREWWRALWRIYRPDGTRMPVEQCPMSVALREGRAIRDVEMIVEQPNGNRRRVMPHPEPVFDAAGKLIGAFNLLLDITRFKDDDELRSRLTAIVHSSDDAIISTDLNGVIISWNAGAERLFGYTAEEAVGQPIQMLIPADRIDEEPDVLARIRRGETINHYETVRRRKDGSLINISLTVSPITSLGGQVVGASKIARDISERTAADHARNMLAAIVQFSDDAIISKNLSGIITSWNRGAERLFGYAREDVIGKSITILIPPERLDEEPQVLARIARGQSIEHYETVRRRKDGSLVDISLTVSPIIDADGKVVGASKIARDISERKRAELALIESDRRKDEFLATLAHELRNPLAPLRNSLHYLRKAGLNTAPPERVIEVMERQVDHLVRLVDDLLEISRISCGAIVLKKEAILLADVLRDAVEISRSMIDARGHRLEITLDPEPAPVLGDRVRLVQVISNLLNNAAKFTPPNGSIWLTLGCQHGWAEIRIADTGVGIPADKLESIFEMFTQVRNSAEGVPSGLGVGLSLARRLLAMHGGTIRAGSLGSDRGSEFVVSLPLLTQATEPRKIVAAAKPAAGLLRRRILVVDDNRDAAESMMMLLKSLGHEAHMALGGEEALVSAKALLPDTIFLDVGMPGLSGYDVASEIRKQPWGKPLRLVALTGFSQASDRHRTAEAGFDHHMVKPVDVEALDQLLATPPARPQVQ